MASRPQGIPVDGKAGAGVARVQPARNAFNRATNSTARAVAVTKESLSPHTATTQNSIPSPTQAFWEALHEGYDLAVQCPLPSAVLLSSDHVFKVRTLVSRQNIVPAPPRHLLKRLPRPDSSQDDASTVEQHDESSVEQEQEQQRQQQLPDAAEHLPSSWPGADSIPTAAAPASAVQTAPPPSTELPTAPVPPHQARFRIHRPAQQRTSSPTISRTQDLQQQPVAVSDPVLLPNGTSFQAGVFIHKAGRRTVTTTKPRPVPAAIASPALLPGTLQAMEAAVLQQQFFSHSDQDHAAAELAAALALDTSAAGTAAQQLNASLKAAPSTSSLYDLLQTHAQALQPLHIATAFYTLSRLSPAHSTASITREQRLQRQRMLKHLTASAIPALRDMPHWCLPCILRACTNLQHAPHELLTALSEEVEARMAVLSSRHLLVSLYALASVGFRSSVFQVASQRILHLPSSFLSQLSTKELRQLLWAFARACVRSTELAACLWGHISDAHLARFDPQDFGVVLWSLARVAPGVLNRDASSSSSSATTSTSSSSTSSNSRDPSSRNLSSIGGAGGSTSASSTNTSSKQPEFSLQVVQRCVRHLVPQLHGCQVATLCQLFDALAHWRSPKAGALLLPALEQELVAQLRARHSSTSAAASAAGGAAGPAGQQKQKTDWSSVQPLAVRVKPSTDTSRMRRKQMQQLAALQQQQQQQQQPAYPAGAAPNSSESEPPRRPTGIPEPLPSYPTGDAIALALYSAAQCWHMLPRSSMGVLLAGLVPELHLLRKSELLLLEHSLKRQGYSPGPLLYRVLQLWLQQGLLLPKHLLNSMAFTVGRLAMHMSDRSAMVWYTGDAGSDTPSASATQAASSPAAAAQPGQAAASEKPTPLQLLQQYVVRSLAQYENNLPACKLNPQELVLLVWLAARSGYRSVRLLDQALPLLQPKVHKLDPALVSHLAWATTRLRCATPQLLFCIKRAVLPRVSRYHPRSLAALAWSFARAGAADAQLLAAVASAINGRWQELEAKDVAKLAWACATAGWTPVALFIGLGRRAEVCMAHLNSTTLPLLLWAFATAGVRHDGLLAAAELRAMELCGSYSSEAQVRCILGAYKQLRYQAPAMAAELYWELERGSWAVGGAGQE